MGRRGADAPDLARLRRYRPDRLCAQLVARACGGALLFDPLNIRYASDTTNMQLWAADNPFRACFVGADGYMAIWDYRADDLLTAFNPLVRETRGGASGFYFASGDAAAADARRFAVEVAALLYERAGPGATLAVDNLTVAQLRAFDAAGVRLGESWPILEKTRSVKGPDEIAAMRCALYACERAVDEMRDAVVPGVTENDVWAALHAANICRGGEWIETRPLSSGPRTNPWFQACGPRVIAAGELLAFDTDMIGCYGICADISRTWLVGDGDASAEHKRLYREAHAQIVDNSALLGPGVDFDALSFAGRPLPEEFAPLRYSRRMHGVGLCDEWPLIRYPADHVAGAFDGVLEPGMTLCVEAYIGAPGGRDGVKLEDQLLVTEDGVENLTRYPFEPRMR